MNQSKPFISAVVCTYNRCETLRRMLRSFYEQEDLDPARFELIVVDNNSSDSTATVAHEFADRPGFRYAFEPRQGLSAARNRGTSEAQGDVVAFLDDDVLLNAGWLKNLALCFGSTDAAAVGGRAHLKFEGERPAWMGPHFQTLLSQVDFGPERREIPGGYGLWGLNLAFRLSALRQAGGFDERLGRSGSQLLGGEESAVLARIAEQGGRCYYEPHAFVEHIISADRLKWDYFVRLARANGASRFIADAPASFTWETLRVVRSTMILVMPALAVRVNGLLGRDDYTTRCAQWDFELLKEHRRLRWRRLVSLLAKVFGPAQGHEQHRRR